LAKKCVFGVFFRRWPKSTFQPARHQQVAKMVKMGRFRARAVLREAAQKGHFKRNLMGIRRIGAKEARLARGENTVTYNNMPAANAK
jgi:hypothetical protein